MSKDHDPPLHFKGVVEIFNEIQLVYVRGEHKELEFKHLEPPLETVSFIMIIIRSADQFEQPASASEPS
jgi:hypothetical protein